MGTIHNPFIQLWLIYLLLTMINASSVVHHFTPQADYDLKIYSHTEDSTSALSPAETGQSTAFASLTQSITSTLTLTLITEFGDRTFILAAAFALKGSKLITFTATSLALVLQTFFSTIAGQILHCLPKKSKDPHGWLSMPFDDYGAGILLFVFGCLHFKAAYSEESSVAGQKPAGPRNLMSQEGQVLKTSCVNLLPESFGVEKNSASQTIIHQDLMAPKEYTIPCNTSHYVELENNPYSVSYGESKAVYKNYSTNTSSASTMMSTQNLIPASQSQESVHTIQSDSFCYIFGVIFAAELGDKSMISTVALSAAQNPYGVFIGGSIAHLLITAVAVTIGSLMHGCISERVLNYIGAVLFMIFAVMTILEGLARQGIHIL